MLASYITRCRLSRDFKVEHYLDNKVIVYKEDDEKPGSENWSEIQSFQCIQFWVGIDPNRPTTYVVNSIIFLEKIVEGLYTYVFVDCSISRFVCKKPLRGFLSPIRRGISLPFAWFENEVFLLPAADFAEAYISNSIAENGKYFDPYWIYYEWYDPEIRLACNVISIETIF